MIRIDIRERSCRGCKLCVEICPTEVLAFDEVTGKTTVAQVEDCIACLSCTYLCPSGAIAHDGHHVVKNFYRSLDFVDRLQRYL